MNDDQFERQFHALYLLIFIVFGSIAFNAYEQFIHPIIQRRRSNDAEPVVFMRKFYECMTITEAKEFRVLEPHAGSTYVVIVRNSAKCCFDLNEILWNAYRRWHVANSTAIIAEADLRTTFNRTVSQFK